MLTGDGQQSPNYQTIALTGSSYASGERSPDRGRGCLGVQTGWEFLMHIRGYPRSFAKSVYNSNHCWVYGWFFLEFGLPRKNQGSPPSTVSFAMLAKTFFVVAGYLRIVMIRVWVNPNKLKIGLMNITQPTRFGNANMRGWQHALTGTVYNIYKYI